MNLFDTHNIASGYAKDRPYPHPIVIKKIRSYLKIHQKLDIALDVGCGAGFSTIALLEIARKVIGVDASKSMISSAIAKEGVAYLNCRAEALPFEQTFDLITLAGSLNWINRPQFFAKVRRILEKGRFIVIYDNDILGIMEEDDRFKNWYETVFEKNYPRPPRDKSPILEQEALNYGFKFEHAQNYTNRVTFDIDRFVRYLFTLSNITAALKENEAAAQKISIWLKAALTPYFNLQKRTIRFGGYIWYLRKI